MAIKNLLNRRSGSKSALLQALLAPPAADRVANSQNLNVVATPTERRDAIKETLRLAHEDTAFCALVTRADDLRDNRQWDEARDAYSHALVRFPLHRGYWVQMGHMLKELGRTTEAEVAYRRAFAFGDVSDDTRQHLTFVATCNGVHDFSVLDRILAYWLRKESMSPLAVPPLEEDVVALTYLLTGRRSVGDVQLRVILASCANLEEVCARIMSSQEFRAANRAMLSLISENSAVKNKGQAS